RVEEGRLPEALEALDRMDALLRQRRPDDMVRAEYLQSRSDTLFELGRLTESEQCAREALAQSVELRGERHPFTARLHYLLSRVLVEAGKAAECREHIDRAERYWSEAGTATALFSLDAGDIRATSFQVEGRYREALAEARRIQALREKIAGVDHADLSFTLDNVGLALLGLGRPAEAVAPLERSLALKTKAGMKMVTTAEGMLALANALWLSGGDRTRARALARDAEQATRIAPAGRVHREAAAWLAAHP
ncbi:MAG TPA: tetratricopeptide repeat protein, partial [Myxococcales bacterium]|nr:tetratricopeptide repeat protein [Myxococcales bacterium]